ncbi:PREDICTED: sn1-specific diacylglycerol lipase alpha-like [Priapulus caudatus]|uniref:Sn1-specific diacylglycerol lipase alpha-like n=1 Tax=Priapulus caudatus TaxID=37621 RepID=A0ABM1F7Z2_PRICU|nr:PREDICTED: sn1-specific diacylglycerol lipase alpha-like [Priapulus caudatus]
MPGIVVFKRRWSVGSDDLVVPAVFLCVLHLVWLVVLLCVFGAMEYTHACSTELRYHVLGYIILMSLCIICEAAISWVSMRGSILYSQPRDKMQYLLYFRLAILITEGVWLGLGIVWMKEHYGACPNSIAKKTILGIVICNWVVLISVLVTLWCTFDAAGRSWVKMQRYQQSLRNSKTKYKRSGNRRRNWRNRKTWIKYQASWHKRCRLLFCCLGTTDTNRNSFTEIAKLLSEFFRDLDVVPSDVVAGLVLLRRQQKQHSSELVAKNDNSIYQFLSGVPVTPETKFLHLNNEPAIDASIRMLLFLGVI